MKYILFFLAFITSFVVFGQLITIDDPGLNICTMTIDGSDISFIPVGGSVDLPFTITGSLLANCNSNVSINNTSTWFSVSTNRTTLTITATENTTPFVRSGYFTINHNNILGAVVIQVNQIGVAVNSCEIIISRLIQLIPEEGTLSTPLAIGYRLELSSSCTTADITFANVPTWINSVSFSSAANQILVHCDPNTTLTSRTANIGLVFNGNLLPIASFKIIQSGPVIFDPPAALANDDHLNWISSEAYNVRGVQIAREKNYFNDLGKPIQSQTVDFKTGRVWANQTIYDSYGRPAFNTLSTPIRDDGTFIYTNFVLKDTGAELTTSDIENITEVSNLPIIATQPNTLGWYYSDENTREAYQDVTSNPYSKTIYSKLRPGAILKTIGGNKIDTNGDGNKDTWLQSYGFGMKAGNELSATLVSNAVGTSYDGLTKITKSISRDVHGIEVVVFTDSNGNTLATARSGNEDNPSRVSIDNIVTIGEQKWVDIHIPTGCLGITINDPQGVVPNSINLIIFDLITEEKVISNLSANSYNLPAGFYRIALKTPEGYTYDASQEISITHQQNYYDYSFNIYDKVDRLKKSIQPLGLESTFKYNSLGQLLETTSADEGTAHFLYRKDGQIRFSQNSKQVLANEFSYTNYDKLGRPIESGVATGDFNNLDPDSNTIQGSNQKEQHFTTYDYLDDNSLLSILTSNGLPQGAYKQTFLSGNVVKTTTDHPKTNTTYYSYDIYGRVRWLIQDVENLGVKTIDYKYDPVTSAITDVMYQRHNQSESFYHKYTYNMVNQLIKVETSTNNSYFIEQAKYFYYETGALKRTELANDLQGIDYVYNLGGQLKAINDPSITTALDPGQDGVASNGINKDVFGIALDYYNGDYTRTGTPTPIQTTAQGANQFNGNIKATRWQTQTPTAAGANAYTYQYNKNNWLQSASFGTANNIGAISFNGTNDYNVSNLSYDQNGNILSLNRNGHSNSGSNAMDNFTYHYKNGKNQLDYVADANDNTDTARYNDLKSQQNSNYIYNSIGQLVSNTQDQIKYEYNAFGLVSRISSFADADTGNWTPIYTEDFSQTDVVEANLWTMTNAYAAINHSTYQYCRNLRGMYGNSLSFYTGLIPAVGGTYNTLTATRSLNVIPNKLHQLSLDFIAQQRKHDKSRFPGDSGGGLILDDILPNYLPNIVGYTINIKAVDGSILQSNTFNTNNPQLINDPDLQSDPAIVSYCGIYYDESNTITFTPTDDVINLEIIVIHSNNVSTIAYIDNIVIEVATSPKLAFFYDDRGHRIRKQTFSEYADGSTTTIYVRDVSGSVMATHYFGHRTSKLEQPFYGATRLGVMYRNQSARSIKDIINPNADTVSATRVNQNSYVYELTDHLGNVRAVIKKGDTAISGSLPSDVVGMTDYYPFGMPMPNRHIQDANGYRYAYQGQEKDPETGKEAFQLRLWDGRIGRWLTTDPYGQHFSPYLGMGNNPISSIDPDGGTNCGGAGQPPCADGGWEMDLPAVEIGSNSIDYRGFDADFPSWTSSFDGNLADWNVANGTDFKDHYAAYDYWSNQQMQSAQKDFLADITRRNEAWKPLYMGIADLMTLGVGAGSAQLMNAGKGLNYLRFGGKTFNQYKTIYWATRSKPLAGAIEMNSGKVFKVYEELHHRFIPQRWKWAPNWLKNNSMNLQQLNTIQHGIRDPYRFRFFPKEIKNAINNGNTFGY